MLTNADLMMIFNFTEDDLGANRAGCISERQVARLKTQNSDAMGCAVSVILSFACIGLVAGMAELAGQPLPRMGSKDTPGLTLLIFGVFVAVAVVATLFRRAEAKTEIE